MDRQFPPEIVQLIVKESVRGARLVNTWADPSECRNSILRSFSTVNSTWSAISKRLLYKHVTINSAGQARRFLQACRAKGNEEAKYWVRSLSVTTGLEGEWVSQNVYQSGEEVIDALVVCVARVRVFSLKSNEIDFSQLAGLTNLRRLHLVGCTITDSPPRPESPSSFPLLAHLDCFNCDTASVCNKFFSTQCLPRLRSLAYREPRAIDGTAQLRDRFESLAPQIKALKLYSDDACSQILPHVNSLSLLSLPSHVRFSTALRHLKTAPRLLHLDLTSSIDTRRSLKDQLRNRRKSGLERVLLNTEDAEADWQEELQNAVDKLGVRGVQVEIGELGFIKAIERMDEILLGD